MAVLVNARAVRARCGALLLAAALCLPAATHGEDGVKLRMSMQITHDTNVFRLPGGRDLDALGVKRRSDLISSVGLGLEANIPYSQQRFQLSLRANDVRYQSNDFLDYAGSNASASWLWRLGKRWNGSLGAQREEVLSDFADLSEVERNVRRKSDVYASARFWLTPDWWLVSKLERVQLANDVTQRTADRDDNYASFGAEYRTQADNSVLLQLRRTDGDAPNDLELDGLPFDNDFRQTDLETYLDWQLNGALRTRARLGYTQRKHNDAGERDFSGLTGYWSQDWFATGKLAFNFTARREIGSYQDFAVNYVETSLFSITPTWAYTEKLRFQAGFDLRKREFGGDPQIALNAAPRRDEDIQLLSISALYSPRRNIDMSVSVRQQERDSNQKESDYRATTLDATLQISF